MSTHRIDVIKIKSIEPHPNADKLDLIKIDEYICCSKKGQFSINDLAVYIPPDYTVPTNRPEFSFLGKRTKERITVKRLRGIFSQGVLIPAPPGFKEGDNVMEYFGIERYEPTPENASTGSTSIKGPDGIFPVYDLENWAKYSHVMKEGEEIYLSEKIHGSNGRMAFRNNQMFHGSRTRWVSNEKSNIWSEAVRQNSWIEEFCKAHQDLTLYGEIFGSVQDLKYGAKNGEIFFRAFDILKDGKWLNFKEISELLDMKTQFVPILYVGPYSKEIIKKYTDGQSLLPNADHIREGVVICPTQERFDSSIIRVKLKNVSNLYYERS